MPHFEERGILYVTAQKESGSERYHNVIVGQPTGMTTMGWSFSAPCGDDEIEVALYNTARARYLVTRIAVEGAWKGLSAEIDTLRKADISFVGIESGVCNEDDQAGITDARRREAEIVAVMDSLPRYTVAT